MTPGEREDVIAAGFATLDGFKSPSAPKIAEYRVALNRVSALYKEPRERIAELTLNGALSLTSKGHKVRIIEIFEGAQTARVPLVAGEGYVNSYIAWLATYMSLRETVSPTHEQALVALTRTGRR